jgi:hypothetical protein
MLDGSERLGYYVGHGVVRLAGDNALQSQTVLELDQATHWRPLDESTLWEFENAELGADPAGERDADR